MSELQTINAEGIEELPIKAFTEKAYYDYSMYVILDRALPQIGDGLKPVQRRIIYAMSELGLKATSKHKKSARTVGDVLGKFHPHGDTACYEAMVLMAQDFSYRYPLIDGQGNWGSVDDPKSFAAMRYTESRLSAYTDILLQELGQGTVDWTPNFDGTLNEPAILPARLPNLLLNGASGIAVGMATDVPPHNLREVADACIHLLKNPQAGTEALCEHILGPDFPTAAEIITPKEELIKIYKTGSGMIRMRAVHQLENGNIVIRALPYQVSGAKVMEQIASQMQAKKLPMVVDLRDESDHEDPTRLVIVPRSNRIDKDTLMAHLYATTDLERSIRVNMNVIGLNGRPQVKGLAALLNEWLVFRIKTVTHRLQYRLDNVNERLHILEGLLIAYLNIDEVIAIIRQSDHPKPILMKRFSLSDRQAEAILNLRLRNLAKLEEIQIRKEQDELSKEKEQLEKILSSPRRLKTLVGKELAADAKTFGDNRRSPIVTRKEAQALSETDLLPVEPVTVVLSSKGWIRVAKGHEVDCSRLSYKAGDQFLAAAKGRSNQLAVILDSTGRSYSLPVVNLPSARGYGEPLSGHLNLPPGAFFQTVLMGASPDDLFLMASDAGYGFIVKFDNLFSRGRNGKQVLNCPPRALPLLPVNISQPETDLLGTITNEGRMLLFPVNKLPYLPKGKGNKIIQIPPKRASERKEWVVQLFVMPAGGDLLIHAGKRHLSLSNAKLSHYFGERGRRGAKLPRGFQKVDRVETIVPQQLPLL